jgi:hypothetical protein
MPQRSLRFGIRDGGHGRLDVQREGLEAIAAARASETAVPPASAPRLA